MGNNHSNQRHSKKSNRSKHSSFSQEEEQTNTDREEQKYYLINSNSDVDRQHSHTFAKNELFQSSFSVPIEDKLIQGDFKVLDVCCGPGTWLLDLASKYKKSSFWGVDIKPTFPSEIKPANLNFVQADVLNGLPFPDNEFDFVSQETMLFVWAVDQWDFIISELVRVTSPGGYIQICETNYIVNKDSGPKFYRLMEYGFYPCSLQRNVDLKITQQLKGKLESQQGITTVHQDRRSVVFGPNGGQIGVLLQEAFFTYVQTDISAETISPFLGISKEEYKQLIKDILEEFKVTRPDYIIDRFWAQKDVN